MAGEVLYVRIPPQLKEATESYAAKRGLTVTSAVVDLLQRGLESVSNEESIQQIQAHNQSLSAALQASLAEADSLKERERVLGTAYNTVLGRTKLNVGNCPHCNASVTGYNLLVEGRCPKCSKSLTPLLSGLSGQAGSLDRNELVFMLLAIGILVGAFALIK